MTLKTAYGVRQRVLAVLAGDTEVEVFTVVPPPAVSNDFPVDMALGLEAGLIRAQRPVRNRRGIGSKTDIVPSGQSAKTKHIIGGTPAIPTHITHSFAGNDTG